MNEKKARELKAKRSDEWLGWTERTWIAEGYLQAIEKANGLEKAIRHQLNLKPAHSINWLHQALAKWEKEK